MWSADRIPDLNDKIIVVTGANSGIGLSAARELAGHGAEVILACRSAAKAEGAISAIRAAHPSARVRCERLDLADLASVRAFAENFPSGKLDVLVNNGGVMTPPYAKTADGFELQFGTNHLGHFALTALLLERLVAAGASRVVTVASLAHHWGAIHFDDLQWEKRYFRWLAYGQSKLANLLFANELARRCETRGISVLSVACHPGYASTNLAMGGARMTHSTFKERFMEFANRSLAQSSDHGALPTLFAATGDDVRPGDYIGPAGVLELVGAPGRAVMTRSARDPDLAKRLWERSEELTGIRFLDD